MKYLGTHVNSLAAGEKAQGYVYHHLCYLKEIVQSMCVRGWAVMGMRGRANYKLAKGCQTPGQLRRDALNQSAGVISPAVLGELGAGTKKTS